jgi:hypothetical protein
MKILVYGAGPLGSLIQRGQGASRSALVWTVEDVWAGRAPDLDAAVRLLLEGRQQ